MRDEIDTEVGPGLARGATVLGLSGAVLLGSTLTSFWTGSVVAPTALAVALLVFGGFLLTVRIGTPRAARPSGIEPFEGHTEPVYLTDLGGGPIAANPAARGARFPGAWLPDGAALYRMTREARANGVAIAETDGHRLIATRQGPRSLLWRVERVAPPPAAASEFDALGVPWLRVDGEGKVVAANPAAVALTGSMPARLAEVLSDPPPRPDGVHMLAASGGAVRAVVLAKHDGGCDLLLTPLGGAEISGLVPDHFLEDLPVALARLETSGVLTYANKAARQLLGERARPGTNIADLLEGMGRSIAERLADTTRGRALGRSEVARGALDGQEIYLQVAFTRAVLDGAPSVLAVLSDATELKTLEAQFVQSQKMQAVGQLAGGVAHDFNNVLQAIIGYSDLLLANHRPTDPSFQDIMQIKQNANRAASLVRQLLAFARALASRYGCPLRLVSFAVHLSPPEVARFNTESGQVLAEWTENIYVAAHRALGDHPDEPPQIVIARGEQWAEAFGTVDWEAGELLVVGSSEAGPIERVFLGSRATKIVRHSPVPVLVVPRAAADNPADLH